MKETARPKPTVFRDAELEALNKELFRLYRAMNDETKAEFIRILDARKKREKPDPLAAIGEATESAPYRYPKDMAFSCPS